MAQTHVLTNGHGDYMTESAQWDQLSEKQKSALRLSKQNTSQYKIEDQLYCQQAYFINTLNKRKRSSKTPLITLVELQHF